MRPKQTREEKLQKKRLAEQRRREKIKNDFALCAQQQEKERQKYLKNKSKGRIIPIREMSPTQQKIMRKKSRASSKRYNQKKRFKEPFTIVEEKNDFHMNCVFDDPLTLTSLHSSNCLAIDSTAPPSPDSNISESSICIKTSVKRNIIDNIHGHQLKLELEATSNQDSVTPSPQSSLDERDFTIASEPIKFSNYIQKQESAHTSLKTESHWKYHLRKFKYRAAKELQIKDRKILELKRLNEQYKKQLHRLKLRKLEGMVLIPSDLKNRQGTMRVRPAIWS